MMVKLHNIVEDETQGREVAQPEAESCVVSGKGDIL